MNSSGNWDQNVIQNFMHSLNDDDDEISNDFRAYSEEVINTDNSTQNIFESIDGVVEVDNEVDIDDIEDLEMSHGTNNTKQEDQQPSLEQIQKVYYTKGLQELESLQLFDLSNLANWKLSSFKQGFGLQQLRDDSPDTYWQSDGSNGNNNSNINNTNQLMNPHVITIQFSKRVSLERISVFTNYSLDESYTPSKIRIMAGTSEGWDLTEVCTVNFNQPIGWSHIIFNGIRNDCVLKCFILKIMILANHQEGKDSHIRAIRCFGKKSLMQNHFFSNNRDKIHPHHSEFLKDLSLPNGSSNLSGFSINSRVISGITEQSHEIRDEDEIAHEEVKDEESSKMLGNVSNIIGFNTGFQSLELKSISSIR